MLANPLCPLPIAGSTLSGICIPAMLEDTLPTVWLRRPEIGMLKPDPATIMLAIGLNYPIINPIKFRYDINSQAFLSSQNP